MNRNAAIFPLFALAASLAHATEGFNDVPGLFTGGTWAQSNLSNPVNPDNTDPWGQGDASQFHAASGPANSYIAANYSATGVDPVDTGTISAWLFAPTAVFNNGDHVKFLTRTATGSTFADRLQVRFSDSGASTFVGSDENSVGNFSNLLLDVNPTLSPSGYPDGWTAYDLTLSGLGGPTSGRIGFRYFVTDSGSSGSNGNIIGLDSYNVQAVPEPTALTGLALGFVAIARRRKGTR